MKLKLGAEADSFLVLLGVLLRIALDLRDRFISFLMCRRSHS